MGLCVAGTYADEVQRTAVAVEVDSGAQAPSGAGQVDAAAGGEVSGELVGQRVVADGEDGGSEREDVAGHAVVVGASGPGDRFAAERNGGGVGGDPSVAIGHGSVGVHGDGVDHGCCACRFAGLRGADRIGSDHQVRARQGGWQRSGDRQAGDAGLVGDRRVVVREEPVVGATGHAINVDLRGSGSHRV